MTSINHFDNFLQSMKDILLASCQLNKLPSQTEKRKRIPSKHAEGINELKRTVNKTSKRQKCSESNQQSQDGLKIKEPQEWDTANRCILPNGRKLKLSIIIKKTSKKPSKKSPPLKILQKQETKRTLLDAFLHVCQKFQTQKPNDSKDSQNNKMDQQNSQFISNEISKKNQSKLKKDKEDQDKYSKLYEKYKILNEKFNNYQEHIILI